MEQQEQQKMRLVRKIRELQETKDKLTRHNKENEALKALKESLIQECCRMLEGFEMEGIVINGMSYDRIEKPYHSIGALGLEDWKKYCSTYCADGLDIIKETVNARTFTSFFEKTLLPLINDPEKKIPHPEGIIVEGLNIFYKDGLSITKSKAARRG